MWLPAHTPPTTVILAGTPSRRGLYTLSGCRVATRGVSWAAPWAAPPPGLAARLGLVPARGPPGSGDAATRVSVCGPLPRLVARLDAPRTSAGTHPHAAAVGGGGEGEGGAPRPPPTAADADDGDEPPPGSPTRSGPPPPPAVVHVAALAGAVLAWRLVLQSDGDGGGEGGGGGGGDGAAAPTASAPPPPPVGWARLALAPPTTSARRRHGGGPAAARRARNLAVAADVSVLQRALPLAPGGRVAVPVLVSPTPALTACASPAEADVTLAVDVAYGSADAGGGGGSTGLARAPPGTRLGRRAALTAHVRLVPSLSVEAVWACPHTCGDHTAVVLAARVTSGADVPLRAWLGPRVPPALPGSAGAEAWAAAASGGPRPLWDDGTGAGDGPLPAVAAAPVLVPRRGGAAAVVATVLKGPVPAPLLQAAAGPVDAATIAALLSHRLALYWRRDGGGGGVADQQQPPDGPALPSAEVGLLALPAASVAAALAPWALDVLVPPAVAVAVRPSGGGDLMLLRPAGSTGGGGDRAATSRGSTPALGSSPPPSSPMAAAVVEAAEPSPAAAGALWGVTAAVGTPLALELALVGGGGGSVDTSSTAAAVSTGWVVTAVPEDGTVHAAAEADPAGPDDPAVAVAGVLRGVVLEAGLGGSATSPASLVFLRAGLFRVAPRVPTRANGGRVGVRPLYVRAE